MESKVHKVDKVESLDSTLYGLLCLVFEHTVLVF